MAGEGVRCFISTGPLRFEATRTMLLAVGAVQEAAQADAVRRGRGGEGRR